MAPGTATRKRSASATKPSDAAQKRVRFEGSTDSQTDATFVRNIVDVCRSGDVILSVGDPDDHPIRLRVSSTVLSLASPVFAAMFSPDRFSEGRNLSSTNPPEISLPEDEEDPMLHLVSMIHGSYDHNAYMEDHTTYMHLFMEVTIVADKYGIARKANSTYRYLLTRIWDDLGKFHGYGMNFGPWWTNMKSHDRDDRAKEVNLCFKLLVASFLLGSGRRFALATRMMMLCLPIDTSFLSLTNSHGTEFLPDKTLEMLDRFRLQQRSMFLRDLGRRYQRQKPAADEACEIVKRNSGARFQFNTDKRIDPNRWLIHPTDEATGLETLGYLIQVSFDEYLASWAHASNSIGYHLSLLRANVTFEDDAANDAFKGKGNDFVLFVQEALSKFRRSDRGLCLSCLKSDDEAALTCTIYDH